MRWRWQLLAWLMPALLAACGGGGSSPSASAVAKPSAAIASAPPASPTAAPTATPSPEASYTVKTGDTLFSIASENKTSADAIARANNITDPDKLQVGQKLVIPGSSGAPAGQAAASGAALPPPASKPPPP